MTEAIDLALLKGTPEQRAETSAALLKTLKTRGVAKLMNHGVPRDLIDQLFERVCLTPLTLANLAINIQRPRTSLASRSKTRC